MRIFWFVVIIAMVFAVPVRADDGTLPDCPNTDTCTLAPSMNKIGFMTSGATGTNGDQVEWIITVQSDNNVDGRDIVITDELAPSFRIDRVESTHGEVVIDGQIVNVSIPTLPSDESAQVRIFTTIIGDDVSLDNTACLIALNTEDICVSGQMISQLPATGETPLSRLLLELAIGMGLILAGAMLSMYGMSTLVERR